MLVLLRSEEEAPTALDEVNDVFTRAGSKYLLLLLTENSKDVPKMKPGLPALSLKVTDVLTERGGPLDESLSNWAEQRPSSVVYQRLLLDRDNTKLMTQLGVCWLPQVRLVRRSRVLFRSSVSVGDNGEFLAQDVGGRSFRRRAEYSLTGFVNLFDALSSEIDKLRT